LDNTKHFVTTYTKAEL